MYIGKNGLVPLNDIDHLTTVTKSALVEDYYSSPPSIFIYIGIFQ